MTTQGGFEDKEWGVLADAPEVNRLAKMKARYQELAGLSEEERRRRMKSMAIAEYALPDDKLRVFTNSRWLTWLDMDMEVARKMFASYDAVMMEMPGDAAYRRVSMVQTMARGFPPALQEKLRLLAPNVLKARAAVVAEVEKGAGAPKSADKKGFWPFGKKP